MISFPRFRILFIVALFILVQSSSQQELFEDAVKQENRVPDLDTSLLSSVDEYDADPDAYNGPPDIAARYEEPQYEKDQEEERDYDKDRRRTGNDGARISQTAPELTEEYYNDNDDDDDDGEDRKVSYDDEASEIEESGKKRSDLKNFEENIDKSKKKANSKKIKSVKKKDKAQSSKTSKKSSVVHKTEEVEASKSKNGKSEDKREENDGSGSEEGSISGQDESSGDQESSGAERERRQAFQTEEQVIKAKEKLENAQEASDALTNIEKEMGLDPVIAPDKTKNLTSTLHSEINKFKDIISHQDDDVKKSKFQKLEKLAEEDVKGANDVMKLIVELEVAKFFAKNRARKKLELALRNKIINAPSSPEPAAPAVTGFGGVEPNPYQGGMADFMPQFQEQGFSTQNPYAAFADQPQPQPQQPSALPFFSVQPPLQPLPVAPAPFNPAPLPPAPLPPAPPQPAPVAPMQNPLQGQYLDNNMLPPRWNPQVASFAPVQPAPQEYNPYVGSPMSYASSNVAPQFNPQPKQQQPNTVMDKPDHKAIKIASKHKITDKAPVKTEHHDKNPQSQPQNQPHQEKFLPKSSPFHGLKPLQSLDSFQPSQFQQHVPSYSTEMQSQTAPYSSYTQNPLAVSSSHPYSDAFSPPQPQQKTQAFYPQSSWTSPPPQVNQFSDSLSRLNPHYQKPAATFKPANPSPPIKAGQRPHPPDLAKMLKELARYHSRPITANQFRPVPAVQPQEPQRLHEARPPAPQTPPMYSQFDYPGQPEPAMPVQQSAPQFTPQYFQPVPQMPYVSPQPAMPSPLPIQDHASPMQYSNEQKNNDEEDEDVDPMDQEFNDAPTQQPAGLQYQGPAVYPQQQQPMQQAYNGYNQWPNPGMGTNIDSFSWPQNPNPQPYGYQPAPSYEQLVNPILTEALNKVHDTQKAAEVVQKIENTIGLSPPSVSHIIDDVESETKKEKMQFDQDIKNDEDEIQKEKNLVYNDESKNKEELEKEIEERKKKLDEDKKRDDIAKTKLATIKKIEKILTIIETAKYSALKRAKEHLMKLKDEKDPQIRKRDLETLERDLNKSEAHHLHKRNEINIWLKGSRNNINTSHFLQGKPKEKSKDQKKKFNVFGAPSLPKLAIARFAARVAKKAKIETQTNNADTSSAIGKRNKIKKPKIGVILMRKLLQRMDDLYDMQSKILTQLIKDHQRVKDDKEKDRRKRSIRSKHHRHHHHHHSS